MPRKPAAQPACTICIQGIKTCWTKAPRGGEGAIMRNRVPEAVKMPFSASYSSPAETYPFFLHLLGYGEHTRYKARSEFLKSDIGANKSAEILNRGGVRVSFDGESLAARYQWKQELGAPGHRTQNAAGMFVPVHHSPAQQALELKIGEWGRILYNGRHSDHDDGRWYYSKHVFNIGLFLNPRPDVFLASQPIKTYSKMALLW